MRIVIFPSPERVTIYPFEGVSAFGRTRKIGGDIVGEYNGTATPAQLPDFVGTFPPVVVSFRTLVAFNELIGLLGNLAHSKIFRAAYPPGNSPEDDDALFFFELARSQDIIDVQSLEVQAALTLFEAAPRNYMTAADVLRVQAGVEE